MIVIPCFSDKLLGSKKLAISRSYSWFMLEQDLNPDESNTLDYHSAILMVSILVYTLKYMRNIWYSYGISIFSAKHLGNI